VPERSEEVAQLVTGFFSDAGAGHRALTGLSRDAGQSIAKTDAALGIGSFAEVLGRR
jgi:hypothetical protein